MIQYNRRRASIKPKVVVESDDSTCSSAFQSIPDVPSRKEQDEHKQRSTRVTFDTGRNVVHQNGLYPKEDVQKLWHSKREKRTFKKTALAESRKILRQQQKRSSSKTPSFSDAMEVLYAMCMSPSASDVEDIAKVVDLSAISNLSCKNEVVERTGMERWILSGYDHQRTSRRAEMIEILRDLQGEAFVGLENREECIAKECKALSRPAVMFARIVAEVQLLAISDKV